jgi:cytochrome P450
MVDYHPYSDEAIDDPYPLYRRLRDEAPAYYVEELDAWFLSRFEDIWQINLNTSALSAARGTTPGHLLAQDTRVNTSLTSMDGKRHAAHRALVSPTFKPGAVKRLEPAIRRFAAEAMAAALPRGEFDVVHDYAAQIAIRTVCMIGGFPTADAELLLSWVNPIFEREPGRRGMTPAGHDASREMYLYFLDRIKELRTDPAGASGLLELLLATDLDGGLSDLDIAAYCSLLLIGGTDTFPKAFANTVLRLHEHPDQARQVRADAKLVDDAFNESLRYTTPTQMLGRTLVRDVELHGRTLRAGQKVMFLFASANRDEREFANPDAFEITRRPPRFLAFGCGPHLCLGMHVARLEARAGLEELFARVNGIEVDTARAERLRTEFVQGFRALPVRFEARG